MFWGEAIWSTLCPSPQRVITCASIQVNQRKTCPCQSEMLRNVHYRDNFLEDRPWVSSPAIVPSNLRRIFSLQSSVIQAQHPTHSGFLAGGLTMRTVYTQPLLTLVWPSVREPVREEEVLLHSKTCHKHHQWLPSVVSAEQWCPGRNAAWDGFCGGENSGGQGQEWPAPSRCGPSESLKGSYLSESQVSSRMDMSGADSLGCCHTPVGGSKRNARNKTHSSFCTL